MIIFIYLLSSLSYFHLRSSRFKTQRSHQYRNFCEKRKIVLGGWGSGIYSHASHEIKKNIYSYEIKILFVNKNNNIIFLLTLVLMIYLCNFSNFYHFSDFLFICQFLFMVNFMNFKGIIRGILS